jgi:hypothetical protein
MSDALQWIERGLEAHLDDTGQAWYADAKAEVEGGLSDLRFGALLSVASRTCRAGHLEPSEDERGDAYKLHKGWDPERWKTLEAARVGLILSRSDLEEEGVVTALEACFQHADEGELCALYRSLAFLPDGARFAWRSGEGCRTNMLTVFEANACDTPYPATHLDELAWRQLIIKALFVGAPLWRVYGLDKRIDAELARMALDLADERCSAHREVQPELWLCLGEHAGERGREAMQAELSKASSTPLGRAGACLGLARSGRGDLVRTYAENETDPLVSDTITMALDGRFDQWVWRRLAVQAVVT